MARRAHIASVVALASALIAGRVGAQTPATTAPATTTPAPWEAPAIGSIAPDFQLAGATRYGLLKTPIRLSDFRDKTVVIAFFARARTKG